MPKKTLLPILAILCVSLVIRFFLLTKTPANDISSRWYPTGDSLLYNAAAKHLVRGEGFSVLDGVPTAAIPPVYPVFVAGIYGLFGEENFTAVRIFQILLSLCAVFFIALLAYQLGGRGAAIVTSAFLAFHPRLVIYDFSILTETLFFFLVALGTFLSFRYHAEPAEKKQRNLFAFISLVFTLGVLTRPSLLPFFGVVFLWAFFLHKGSLGQFVGKVAPGIAVFFLVIGIWTFRNWQIFRTFVPLFTGSGHFLLASFDRKVAIEPYGTTWDRDLRELEDYKKYAAIIVGKTPQEELEAAEAGYRVYWGEVRRNPIGALRVYAQKFIYFWKPTVRTGSPAFDAAYGLFSALYIVGGIAGLALTFKKHRWLFIMYFVPLFLIFSVSHAMTIPQHRYRFPVIDPYLILFASYAAAYVYNKLMTKQDALPA